jgi:hypothetical protein
MVPGTGISDTGNTGGPDASAGWATQHAPLPGVSVLLILPYTLSFRFLMRGSGLIT